MPGLLLSDPWTHNQYCDVHVCGQPGLRRLIPNSSLKSFFFSKLLFFIVTIDVTISGWREVCWGDLRPAAINLEPALPLKIELSLGWKSPGDWAAAGRGAREVSMSDQPEACVGLNAPVQST